MEVHLSSWQTDVWDDEARFKVVCAGRRSGKSVLSQLTVINWATEEKGLYWIVAPTYRQAKQIHWNGIQELIPQAIIRKKNEVELSITLKNGSIIELKGAENPDTLRGVKLRGLVVDEIASIRNWDWLWHEVLRPTLTDYEAPAIFISTPKGFNHFHKLYLQGQDSTTGYRSWQFSSYDNPYIPSKEIDAAKEELTEDAFEQEYMASFKTAVGLAHKEFDRTRNLIDEFPVPVSWQRARGFDYGSAHPTASVRIAIDGDDNWFVERCYLQGKSTIKDHAEAIKAQDFSFGFVPAWGDPSGAQWFTEFNEHDLPIQPANKETGQNVRGWVEHCVEKVNERLKPRTGHVVRLPNGEVIEDAPRLFVLNTHENEPLVQQIENLKWKENRTTGETLPILDETDDPTKGHYDLLAALRYLVVSYRNVNSDTERLVIKRNSEYKTKWQIT